MLAAPERRLPIGPAVWLPALAAVAAPAAGLLIGWTSAVLGLGLVVAVVLAGAVLASDDAALLAVVAVITLLPFGTLPVNLGLSPTFLDLLCLVLLVRWLARRIDPRQPTTPRTPLDALVWGWLGIALVALLAGSGGAALTSETLHYFVKVVLSVLLFFFVVDVARTRQQVQRLYAAFCLGGAGAAIVGLALYALHPATSTRLLNVLGFFHYPTGADVLRYRVDFNQAQRAIATSVDPNVLGGLLMLALVLTLAQLAARRPVMPRRLSVALVVPMLPCLLLTYSRSAWLGLLAALVVIGALRYRRLLLVGLIVLAIFLQLPVSRRFTNQLYSGLEAKDKAAAMRLGEASDALRLIGTYPAFGVGFGSSPDLDLYVGVSNIYLLMAEEMGVAGLAVFAAIIAVFYWWLLSSLPRIHDPPTGELALALLAATVAAFGAGMLDRYFFSFQSDIALLWLLLGLTAAGVRAGRSPVPATVVPRRITRPALRASALRAAR